MSDPLLIWLDHWSIWLDGLLGSGLASPGETTRQQMQTFLQEAEILGYHEQAEAIRELLGSDTKQQRRVDLYYRLLVQHDLMQRLLRTHTVCERYASETLKDEN